VKILFMLIMATFASLRALAGGETFISGRLESGAYAGPEIKVSRLFDELKILVGGRGGWIINHRFVIGGAGYCMVSEESIIYFPPGGDFVNPCIKTSYGGLLLEYVVNSNKIEHFSLETIIGAGSISLKDHPFINTDESDAFFLLEPGANFIINLTRFFRCGVGIGYRFARDVEFINMENADLSGPSYKFFLRFGSF
jgi:hypothetical protein